MCNPPYIIKAKGLRMIVLVYPIPTSSFNDFCTCIYTAECILVQGYTKPRPQALPSRAYTTRWS